MVFTNEMEFLRGFMKKKMSLLFLGFAVIGVADVATSFDPNIRVNASGDAVMVWSGFNGDNFVIQEATLIPEGNWSAPTQISASGYDAFDAKAAMNDNGQILFVWQRYNGSYFEIQASFDLFGEDPAAPVQLSRAANQNYFPSVCIDQNGNGGAIWQESSSSGYTVSVATYSHVVGWCRPEQLTLPSRFLTTPDIAIHPSSGDIMAIWQGQEGSSIVIQAALHHFGQDWTPLTTLSAAGNNATNPCIMYSLSGEVLAVWQRSIGECIGLQISSFIDGIWSQPISMMAEEAHFLNPRISINASGEAVLVAEYIAEDQDEASSSIVAWTRDSGGTWSDYVVISEESGNNAVSPCISMNSSRQAIAVWSDSVLETVWAATLSPSGDWSLPVTLSSAGSSSTVPCIGMNDAGYAIATWQAFEGTNTLARASVLPSLEGTWGEPETVSASQ
jgi:hypothetical protein